MQPTEAGFEDGEEEEEEEDEKLTWTAAVIQSTAYNAISLPIVLFAVVANDVRCLLISPSADFAFYIAMMVPVAFYATDILLHTLALWKGYLWSFFFVLDLLVFLACVYSVLPFFGADITPSLSPSGHVQASLLLCTIANLICLMRFFWLVLLLNVDRVDLVHCGFTGIHEQAIPMMAAGRLKKHQVRNSIALAFGVAVGVLCFYAFLWMSSGPSNHDLELRLLHSIFAADCQDVQAVALGQLQSFFGPALLYVQIFNETKFNNPLQDIRPEEVLKLQYEGVEVWLSAHQLLRLHGSLDLGLMGYTLALLFLGTELSLRSVKRLFVVPLQGMLQIVNLMKHDPMAAIETPAPAASPYRSSSETDYLLSTFQKFARMMQMSLGDAGAGIITHAVGSSSQLLGIYFHKGIKVNALYGFCDIRNFTGITNYLQEDVVNFINKIAAIVHDVAVRYGGHPNKSVGDAFLLVWRHLPVDMGNAFLARDDATKELLPPSTLAELAVVAFLNILQQLAAATEIRAMVRGYQSGPPRMGVGLHYGWSVEAAIGSDHSVCATYVSPHVNVAARLESATKQYGVDLLLSSAVVDRLPSDWRVHCRLLDRVQLLGNSTPTPLFTIPPFAFPWLQAHQERLLGVVQSVRTLVGSVPSTVQQWANRRATRQTQRLLLMGEDRDAPFHDWIHRSMPSHTVMSPRGSGSPRRRPFSPPTGSPRRREVLPTIEVPGSVDDDGSSHPLDGTTPAADVRPECWTHVLPAPLPHDSSRLRVRTSSPRLRRPRSPGVIPRASDLEDAVADFDSATPQQGPGPPEHPPMFLSPSRHSLHDYCELWKGCEGVLEGTCPGWDFRLWSSCIRAYLDGEWATAVPLYQTYLGMYPEDRAAQICLTHMQETAPSAWEGFRPLTEK